MYHIIFRADQLSKCQKESPSTSSSSKQQTVLDSTSSNEGGVTSNDQLKISDYKSNTPQHPYRDRHIVLSPASSKKLKNVEIKPKTSSESLFKDSGANVESISILQETRSGPGDECLKHKREVNPSSMEKSTIDQKMTLHEKMDSTDDSSSRKTSSSSNGSNSTSDSSSSFSSHPLKTLPEHPNVSANKKPLQVKFSSKDTHESTSEKKSLLWQDDPGQLLNAWLGELDNLQKVKKHL